MELWLLWTLAGFALVIAELVTGTFYLLVLGLGAFAAAIAAFAGLPVLGQAIAAGAVALIGAWLVNLWHRRQPDEPAGSNFLDRGQPVVLEGWANEPAGIARVKYRGASWDARVVAAAAPPLAPGATLYIEGQDGNLLLVGAAPPGK